MTLSDLISRLESAEEGSRELDKEIGRLIGATPKVKNIYRRNYYPLILLRAEDRYERFTTSIDAAITLVPDGRAWSVGQCINQNGPTSAYVANLSQMNKSCPAATPALAICISALKAIRYQTEESKS